MILNPPELVWVFPVNLEHTVSPLLKKLPSHHCDGAWSFPLRPTPLSCMHGPQQSKIEAFSMGQTNPAVGLGSQTVTHAKVGQRVYTTCTMWFMYSGRGPFSG